MQREGGEDRGNNIIETSHSFSLDCSFHSQSFYLNRQSEIRESSQGTDGEGER